MRACKILFFIGSSRMDRISKNNGKKQPGGQNYLSITDAMIEVLNQFLASLPTEPGYPCHHRRMKTYLVIKGDEQCDSFPLLYERYV